MSDDRWFRLINDEVEDIPARVQRVKSSYTQRVFVFLILLLLGAALMAFSRNSGQAAVGCFTAVTGIAGIMALSVMAHTQLCLYRAIKEIRALQNHNRPKDQ